ncbi:hypothetical protein E2562_030858 [Oryza meyeriana var. granulata]|uniref:C2H2-type domain-containing protein n=1 Tax=Oryza meyeriana var. granulata TaxID=110450 RepID=A0A6G1F011_9ORYZ|nr:hypothetical protein E2562_030858 [Oryza meyeriana var. granulata]
MAAPLPGNVKEESEGNMDSAQSGQAIIGQDFMDIFRNDNRLRELLMKVGQKRASGSSAKPALPPPVQQQPLPPPPPPEHGSWGKRPATGPPPGFAGVRQPPQKQLLPPRRRAQQQPAAQAASQPSPHHHRDQSSQLPGGEGPAPAANALSIRKKTAAVFCGVCNVKCMTPFNLREHEAGRKHRDKVAMIAGEKNVRCQVCDVMLASELNVAQHYAGRQHLQRLRLGRRGGGGNGTTGSGQMV